jgi:hypothetical protein
MRLGANVLAASVLFSLLAGCGPDNDRGTGTTAPNSEPPVSTVTLVPTSGPTFLQTLDAIQGRSLDPSASDVLGKQVEGWQGWIAWVSDAWEPDEKDTLVAGIYMLDPYATGEIIPPGDRSWYPTLEGPDLTVHGIRVDERKNLLVGEKAIIGGTIATNKYNSRYVSLSNATLQVLRSPRVAPQHTDLSDLKITLTRTGCFRNCPAYKVTILGDGEVVYEGYYDVGVNGTRTDIINREQVADLVAMFERVGFFSLDDEYPPEGTDARSAIASITINGETKTVRHDFSSARAPRRLSLLDENIDEVVQSDKWVRTGSDK